MMRGKKTGNLSYRALGEDKVCMYPDATIQRYLEESIWRVEEK